MYFRILPSVPSAASLHRDNTSVQQMGSCWCRGWKSRYRVSGRAAAALGMLSSRTSYGRAGWYSKWSSSCSGGGMRCWFGEWVNAGFQKGFVSKLLLRSKTTSDARQNLVGAGEELKGSRRRATAMFRTTAMHAAAILPCMWRRRYAFLILHLCIKMGVVG
eukprot:8436152-Ditylum_brightwellii.AAC.2